MPQTTDWADVQVVGIPRALLFYRFGVLWTTFFESIAVSYTHLTLPTNSPV